MPLPLTEETGFAFTADDLAERLTPRTKLVILNSPANPTGGIVDRELNAEIARLLADHACWILSDEVYSELLYDADHDSIAAHEGLLDRTILVDGFSKTFAMTGWRLGYAALPEPLVEPITRLLINSVSCTAPAVQLAGVAALAGPRDEVDAMRDEFRRRRDAVVDGLNALPGVSCVTPRGAFYAFPNIIGTGLGARARRPAARRRGCCGAGGNRVRRIRRGLPPAVLRQFAREHRAGARCDGQPPGRAGAAMSGPAEVADFEPNRFEVDLGAVRGNVAALRGMVGPGCGLYAALKCDAYGFGLVPVARALTEAGVDALAVSRIPDALALRKAGLTLPILLYAGAVVTPGLVEVVERHRLTPTILDLEAAERFSGSLTE